MWITVWAIICFITSITTALTLTIGGGRIKARPLISLAICYCLISIGWGLRMFSGRMLSSTTTNPCVQQDKMIQSTTNDFITTTTQPQQLQQDGLSNVNCAFVFLLLYYFGMAANVW